MDSLNIVLFIIVNVLFVLHVTSPYTSSDNINEYNRPKLRKDRFYRAEALAEYIKGHFLEASTELQAVVKEILTEDDGLYSWKFCEEIQEDRDGFPFKPRDYCNKDLSNLRKALDSLTKLDDKLITSNVTCPLCLELFGVLQRFACSVVCDMWAKLFIRVCEVVLDKVGESSPAMCNGTISLQAPFMYTVLRESTPYDYCDTLNMCLPPPEADRLPVREKVSRLLVNTESRLIDRTRPMQNGHSNPIKILHLADIHISTRYTTGSATDCGMYVCCRDEYPGNGSARMYGEYTCNIPERTMHHILNSAKELKPDFIVYTGDSPPHTIWDESLESQLNCSSIVVKALREHFPDVRIYPSIGNHEMFPTNIYTLDERYNNTVTMNGAFAELWRDLADFGEEQEETMREMAFYTMLIPGYNNKLRILSVNTNHYWYTINFMAPLNRNTTEEEIHRQFIVNTLRKARENGEKVIIIGHHPVGSLRCIVHTSRWLESVVLQFSDVIIMMLSGHTHIDQLHVFTDWQTGLAKVVNYVMLSVTSNTYVNPSVRMFYLDDVTLDVINYENYYADLESQDADTPSPLKMNYGAKEIYGLQDLSAESWKDLSIRFIDDTELFRLWYVNRQGKAPTEKCTGDCYKFHICSMWFPNYDEIEECVLNWETHDTSGSRVCCSHLTFMNICLLFFVLLTRFCG